MQKQEVKDDDDWIYVVQEKSEINKPLQEFFSWQKAIKNHRVIPFPASIDAKSWNNCEGKVRGRDIVRLSFIIETGITLRYKKREWREHTQVEIDLPFKIAKRIADDVIKTVKRYEK
jgi:hypothetical protein